MSLYLIESGCLDVLQIERCTEKSNLMKLLPDKRIEDAIKTLLTKKGYPFLE